MGWRAMPKEPKNKRTYVFIDGQNLFHAVKDAFGYTYPNYDVKRLVETVCSSKGLSIDKIFFYTGVPNADDDERWNTFWNAKLAAMGRVGINTFSRALRYRNQKVKLPDGSSFTTLVAQEKGIDVRIALDIVKFAREALYDVALVFSQDQDLSEVADEIKSISKYQKRWIKMACAYPVSPTYDNRQGINGTEWITVGRDTYNKCIDMKAYGKSLKGK
jgi:uncharacterized LabA/DUF88 family protein